VLGDKGKKIIKFMEDKDLGLTINQAALMFYPKKFAYDYARLKLKKMWEMGCIKKYTSNYSNELIYYFDKKPSFHNNSVLNVYANFVSLGYKIKEFREPECEWMDGKYKSDGFIVAENDKEIRIVIIEVDHSSITNLKKYEELFESGDLQRKYGDFPLLLILTDTDRTYKSENFEIVSMDVKCSDFQKVLI
jgi:hypothetical protein